MAYRVDFVAADVQENLACDVDALIDRINERTRIIFLANPMTPLAW